MALQQYKWAFSILILLFEMAPFLEQPLLAQECAACIPSELSQDVSSTLEKPRTDMRASNDAWVIHQRVDEVTVLFTVTTGQKYVDDLTQNEIRITDGGKPPARISMFGHQSDLPLRLGLLVDTSDSVNYRFNFEKDAASQFLRKIVRPGTDKAFLEAFALESNIVQDYTDQADALAQGISLLNAGGATAMYDAIVYGCEKLSNVAEREPAARILVVLSDGDDNSSQDTLHQAIAVAQRRQVTVYTVSVNGGGFLGSGDRNLKELALQTGGRMFFPKDAKTIVEAFSAIEQEMRSRYAISYQPSDVTFDGRFRRIEIAVVGMRKKLHVHARKGYNTPLSPQAR